MSNTIEAVELSWRACSQESREGHFIQDALQQIEDFRAQQTRIPGFETSNFFAAAGVLNALAETLPSSGKRFCEWGSGFGVVTCLAAMAGYVATGIELEETLVVAAKQLAADHQIDARLIQGSYRPEGVFADDIPLSAFTELLGFSPFDFDVIYAYPWPAEADLIERLYARFAQPGALLICYQGGGRFRLQRAV